MIHYWFIAFINTCCRTVEELVFSSVLHKSVMWGLFLQCLKCYILKVIHNESTSSIFELVLFKFEIPLCNSSVILIKQDTEICEYMRLISSLYLLVEVHDLS